MPAPSPIIKGLTTIKWGTSSTLTEAAFTSAIVMRGSFTPKNGAPIEIEDNNGFAAALVFLDDGFDATIECVYDSAITWPTDGDEIAVKRPDDDTARDSWVCSLEHTVERKKEATVSMKICYRPGVAHAA